MPKQFPTTIYNFLVADSLRQESTGKTTIIGAFAAGVILLLEKVRFPVAIPMGVYVVFRDGEGEFQCRVSIIDSNGNFPVNEQSIGTVSKNAGQGLQLLINLPNFVLQGEGKYIVRVSLDDKVYEDSFTVSFAPAKPTGT